MRRGTILLPFDLVETDRMHPLAFPRGANWLLVSVLVVAVFNGVAALAGAALSKPTYAAGDRWVYVLDGSLNAFPNLNSSQTGAFFFFQAEDGIRDYKVTGVQTCALPI